MEPKKTEAALAGGWSTIRGLAPRTVPSVQIGCPERTPGGPPEKLPGFAPRCTPVRAGAVLAGMDSRHCHRRRPGFGGGALELCPSLTLSAIEAMRVFGSQL